ncbi:MAG: polysaccharide deacetylase [Acidimicrobiia bacterium]|nr:polysaccharide deacetylase [Acidimicrobiia bacterium]
MGAGLIAGSHGSHRTNVCSAGLPVTAAVASIDDGDVGSIGLGRSGRRSRRRLAIVVAVVVAVALAGWGSERRFWPRSGPPPLRVPAFVALPAPVRRAAVWVDGAPVVEARVPSWNPTVGGFLNSASIAPRDGHLLTAGSHTAIPGPVYPGRITIAGVNATAATPVPLDDTIIEVANGPDQTEGVTTRTQVVIPAPTPAPVERTLWHPGTPGTASEVVGQVSGELVGSTVTKPAVAATPVTDNVVALTFDDGPAADTAAFLAVLTAKDVRATFCMVGQQVLAHRDVVRQVVAAGMTLCNHTFDHNEHLSTADAATMDVDIQRGKDAQITAVGAAPLFYRAPGGNLSPDIERVALSKGEQVLGWSVDTADYRRPPAQTIVDRVLAGVKPGAIILLHDGGGDRSQTLAALPVIIDRLRAAGYAFTVPTVAPPGP